MKMEVQGNNLRNFTLNVWSFLILAIQRRILVKEHNSDPNRLREQLLNMAHHYSGDHRKCYHQETFVPKYIPLKSPEVINAMGDTMKYYSDRAEHFKVGRITNTIESMNRMLVSYRSKNMNQKAIQ